MSSTHDSSPTPTEASALLEQASRQGQVATTGANWPYIAFFLALGGVTSLGTLAMSLTTGAAYFVCMIALLAWVPVLVIFMTVFGRSAKRGFLRRWRVYMTIWAVVYGGAVFIAGTSEGRDVVGGCLAAGALLLVAVGCAWREALA